MDKPIGEHNDERILAMIADSRTVERGFRLLLTTYQERLYWQIRRLVHDHDDANDVLQNCLVKVFRGIQHFERKSKLFTWLYKIATNEAITFLNKKKQQPRAFHGEMETTLASQLKADPYFDGDELQVRLKEAVTKLPEKQQIVFNLRYYDEMSYADMSEVLDTSEGALKASFHHAVKKIEHFVKSIS